jgi:hypothetical protein
MPKILLTTVHRPMGVAGETCTPNIQAEMYHAQVTRAQDIFSIRSVCNGWGLQFIAANLDAATTVLHYPTKRRFIRELRKDYDYVGISFVICTFPKAIEMCRWVREQAPRAKLVLGGYGTVLNECDKYADYVCREEGVNFFKRLLKHPHFNTERLEALVGELFRREYEELGPSVCCVLDVQLEGCLTLRDSEVPLFRRRAEEYKKLCLEIYPLLNTAIRRAPSDRVRRSLGELKERVEDTFHIPRLTRLKEAAVPLLASYSRMRDRVFPSSQPRTLVKLRSPLGAPSPAGRHAS